MIRYENGAYHYFDRNGTELHDGDVVQYESGNRQKLYLTENGWARHGCHQSRVDCQRESGTAMKPIRHSGGVRGEKADA